MTSYIYPPYVQACGCQYQGPVCVALCERHQPVPVRQGPGLCPLCQQRPTWGELRFCQVCWQTPYFFCSHPK